MLGLGSNMMKHPVTGKSIVRDNLVLQHNYTGGAVQPLSDGAAAINADADGTDFIDVGLIPITTNDVSVSAWVYITDFISGCAIFSNRHGSSPNQGFAIRTATSPDKFQVITDEATTGSATASSSSKNTNQWYHVCVVLDRSGSQYLYVDGVLDGSSDISGLADSLTHTTSARIGKNFSSYEMNGYVCNVGYWDRVLSQAQIKSIMNKNYAGLSDSEKTDLVSWWNLDSVIPDTTTLVYDNHHGDGDTLGSELALNTSFSGGTLDSSLPTDWEEVGSPTTAVKSNDKVYIGTHSIKVTGDEYDGINQGQTDTNDRFSTVSGKTYKVTWSGYLDTDSLGTNYLSILLKDGGGGSVTLSGTSASMTLTYGQWIHGEAYFTSAQTGSAAYIYHIRVQGLSGTSRTVYIDNISIKPINGNTGTLS